MFRSMHDYHDSTKPNVSEASWQQPWSGTQQEQMLPASVLGLAMARSISAPDGVVYACEVNEGV